MSSGFFLPSSVAAEADAVVDVVDMASVATVVDCSFVSEVWANEVAVVATMSNNTPIKPFIHERDFILYLSKFKFNFELSSFNTNTLPPPKGYSLYLRGRFLFNLLLLLIQHFEFTAPRRTGGGNARRSRSRDTSPSHHTSTLRYAQHPYQTRSPNTSSSLCRWPPRHWGQPYRNP